MPPNKIAALRVSVGRQSMISQAGVADGLRYLYGPPNVVRGIARGPTVCICNCSYRSSVQSLRKEKEHEESGINKSRHGMTNKITDELVRTNPAYCACLFRDARGGKVTSL